MRKSGAQIQIAQCNQQDWQVMELLQSMGKLAADEAKEQIEKQGEPLEKTKDALDHVAEINEHHYSEAYVEDAQTAGVHDGTEVARLDFENGHISEDPHKDAELHFERSFPSYAGSQEAEKADYNPLVVPDLTDGGLAAFATTALHFSPLNEGSGERTYDQADHAYVNAYQDNYSPEVSKEFDQKLEDRFDVNPINIPETGWHAPEPEVVSAPVAVDTPAAALDYSPPQDTSSSYQDHSTTYNNDSGYSTSATETYSAPSTESHSESPGSSSTDSSSGIY
jgi:hypothetical protein